VNGLLFEPDAGSEDFASRVRALIADMDAYRRLAHTSYDEYNTRLNWTSSGTKVRSLIEQLL
jgi:hypothetical protein